MEKKTSPTMEEASGVPGSLSTTELGHFFQGGQLSGESCYDSLMVVAEAQAASSFRYLNQAFLVRRRSPGGWPDSLLSAAGHPKEGK